MTVLNPITKAFSISTFCYISMLWQPTKLCMQVRLAVENQHTRLA